MNGRLTVGELIDTLKKVPKDNYVALSTDSEGNSFSIIMDTHFIEPSAYMVDELGSQYDYFTKQDVDRAKQRKDRLIKKPWRKDTIKVDNLHKVIVLFGSN